MLPAFMQNGVKGIGTQLMKNPAAEAGSALTGAMGGGLGAEAAKLLGLGEVGEVIGAGIGGELTNGLPGLVGSVAGEVLGGPIGAAIGGAIGGVIHKSGMLDAPDSPSNKMAGKTPEPPMPSLQSNNKGPTFA